MESSILILACVGMFAILFSGGVLAVKLAGELLKLIPSYRRRESKRIRDELSVVEKMIVDENDILDDIPYIACDPGFPDNPTLIRSALPSLGNADKMVKALEGIDPLLQSEVDIEKLKNEMSKRTALSNWWRPTLK